jgi:hypothetical protein
MKADHNRIYEKDIVPDSDTASKIAEAIAIPIYGKDNISREHPLVAKLNGDVWLVTGTLQKSWFSQAVGGVVEVEISKKDGRIISITHGK